ncbi:unnamed protein product [Effrenium voratum]|nr:unnamed protein product [Effrenium voratum]
MAYGGLGPSGAFASLCLRVCKNGDSSDVRLCPCVRLRVAMGRKQQNCLLARVRHDVALTHRHHHLAEMLAPVSTCELVVKKSTKRQRQRSQWICSQLERLVPSILLSAGRVASFKGPSVVPLPRMSLRSAQELSLESLLLKRLRTNATGIKQST